MSLVLLFNFITPMMKVMKNLMMSFLISLASKGSEDIVPCFYTHFTHFLLHLLGVFELHWCLVIFIYLCGFFWCLVERESVCAHESTIRSNRRRGRSMLPVGSPMQDSIPGPQDHSLSGRQMLNQPLSHPGVPALEGLN